MDEDLVYLSFVAYAVEKTKDELPGTDPVAMRLGMTLHRLAGALVYDWESNVHRPHGWSWGGFRVLFVLWLAGPREPRHVARLSGMSRAAVSALVKTLERDGLVTRTPVPHDRRAVRLSLSPHGRTAVADAVAAHNAREQAWFSALSPAERSVLIGLLEKLTTSPAAADAQRLG
ncbi:MAG TPA: MarR family transcriptional regulator [Amycolatopsis sp.]|nr:MarR family transcriptional regulator [Amycolatopsis sp.]